MTETLAKKNKLKTGHCLNGWHEGSKSTGYSGTPAPNCQMFATCPCACHETFNEMFEMSGRPRIPIDNSGYKPDRSFWVPSSTEIAEIRLKAAAAKAAEQVQVLRMEHEDTAPVVVRIKQESTDAPKTNKGQLDAKLTYEANCWLMDHDKGVLCTPDFLLREMMLTDPAMPKPSVGAINYVLNAWHDVGFAEIQKKPVRFVRFTDEGKQLGLASMKEKAKQASRRSVSEAGRRVPSVRKK